QRFGLEHGLVKYLYFSLRREHQTQQHPYGGGLAGAVGAQEAEHALLHRQVQPPDGRQRAVALRQASGLDGVQDRSGSTRASTVWGTAPTRSQSWSPRATRRAEDSGPE